MRWPLTVPVLTDGDVTLRAHTPADLDAMLEMARDPEMIRWTSIPDPYSPEMARQFALEHIPKGWDEGTARGFAIEAFDDDGKARFAGNIDVRGTPIADVGFALHPWARGRGIMTRALRMATDWCFTHAGVEIVHWRAHVGNESSLRVAHAAGFTLHALMPGVLHERGRVLDAWTGSLRFGDAPIPQTRWAEPVILESDRLRLRPFRDGDVPRIVQACSDEDSRHWLGNLATPYTDVTARTYIANCVWNAACGRHATWGVADRESDQLLGSLAVMDLNGINPTWGEVGYWLHPDARGRGVMADAVRLLVPHAFDPDGLDRHGLLLMAADGNEASNRTALAAGFTPWGRQHRSELLRDGTEVDLHAYELLR